jgi:hypothetical protein
MRLVGASGNFPRVPIRSIPGSRSDVNKPLSINLSQMALYYGPPVIEDITVDPATNAKWRRQKQDERNKTAERAMRRVSQVMDVMHLSPVERRRRQLRLAQGRYRRNHGDAALEYFRDYYRRRRHGKS